MTHFRSCRVRRAPLRIATRWPSRLHATVTRLELPADAGSCHDLAGNSAIFLPEGIAKACTVPFEAVMNLPEVPQKAPRAQPQASSSSSLAILISSWPASSPFSPLLIGMVFDEPP